MGRACLCLRSYQPRTGSESRGDALDGAVMRCVGGKKVRGVARMPMVPLVVEGGLVSIGDALHDTARGRKTWGKKLASEVPRARSVRQAYLELGQESRPPLAILLSWLSGSSTPGAGLSVSREAAAACLPVGPYEATEGGLGKSPSHSGQRDGGRGVGSGG